MVLIGVPADTHQAGLGSERDIQTVPPASGPDVLDERSGSFVPTMLRVAQWSVPAGTFDMGAPENH